jgi:hypothetical protein
LYSPPTVEAAAARAGGALRQRVVISSELRIGVVVAHHRTLRSAEAHAPVAGVPEERHGVRLAVVVSVAVALRLSLPAAVLRLRLRLLGVGHAAGAAAGLRHATAVAVFRTPSAGAKGGPVSRSGGGDGVLVGVRGGRSVLARLLLAAV